MALVANSFSKCAPAISTNIRQCGSVTLCNAVPLEVGDLTDVYMKSGNYRVMEALLMHDMEIKMCEAVQNGMYDFMMANKVNLSKRIKSDNMNSGLIEIAPFIMARQFSPINDEYWIVGNGRADGNNWVIEVTSSTNIPIDLRLFPAGRRVYIDSMTNAGTKASTAWAIVSAVDNGDDTADLTLTSQNANSFLDVDKLTSPVKGVMTIGSNNVSDYEKFCNEDPSYINWKNVPFWFETTRTSLCKSSNYDKWRALLLENNPLYREFGDLDDIQRNKQLGRSFQKSFVHNIFFSKPLPNQSLSTYNDLETIDAFDGSQFGLGVDGATCQGKRANVVGVYEQLAECGQIVDLQGAGLNLPALFRALYNISRVREGIGNKPDTIDIFTDSVTAEAINQAMIKYYSGKSNNTMRMTLSIDNAVKSFNTPVASQPKNAEFGFRYRAYPLQWPALTMNIVTHYFFDDYLSAGARAYGASSNMARVLWILDFAGIYPGILATNKVIAKTGDLKTMASVNSDYACVMKVPTREQTLTSTSYTVVVECPKSNLIIENWDSSEIEPLIDNGLDMPSGGTTTTTTYH